MDYNDFFPLDIISNRWTILILHDLCRFEIGYNSSISVVSSDNAPTPSATLVAKSSTLPATRAPAALASQSFRTINKSPSAVTSDSRTQAKSFLTRCVTAKQD